MPVWNTIFPKLQSLLPRLKLEMEELERRKEEQERQRAVEKEKRRIAHEKKKVEKKLKKEKRELEKKQKKQKKREKQEKRLEKPDDDQVLLRVKVRLAELETELSELYKQYVAAQPDNEGLSLIPNISDMLLLLPEPLRTSAYNRSLPSTQLWNSIVHHLPSIFATYTKKLQDRCWNLLLGTRGNIQISQKEELMSIRKDPTTILFVGWAFFRCTSKECASLPAARYPVTLHTTHGRGILRMASITPTLLFFQLDAKPFFNHYSILCSPILLLVTWA